MNKYQALAGRPLDEHICATVLTRLCVKGSAKQLEMANNNLSYKNIETTLWPTTNDVAMTGENRATEEDISYSPECRHAGGAEDPHAMGEAEDSRAMGEETCVFP